MDPVSQGALGAVLTQALAGDRSHLRTASLVGFLAGMLADVDVVIRSHEDPLLFLEYHRHFTHSLIFIPVGGLVASLLLYPLFRTVFRNRQRLSFTRLYFFATLGYATHGLLDACTTYGTQLLWPFSYQRIAWNTISIVDPLFTIPLLIFVAVAAFRKQIRWARVGLVYALLYLFLGWVQHERAVAVGVDLARARGDTPLRLQAQPTFGNLILWKIVYETDARFHVDAARLMLGSQIFSGDSLLKLDVQRDFPWLDPGSVQRNDIERFRWFSDGYVARHPHEETVVGDIRYSLLPNQVAPLWGIRLHRDRQDAHAVFEHFRQPTSGHAARFWQMLRGLPATFDEVGGE